MIRIARQFREKRTCQIATWYSDKAATPLDRWYGTYNVAEPMATTLARTYTALGVPAEHTFPLKLAVREGRPAHGEGISNPDHQDIWDRMLGDGYLVGKPPSTGGR